MNQIDSELVWKPLNRSEFGIIDSISNLVHSLETQYPNMLTSVRRGPKLFFTSDYSGQHKSSRFETYSFLIADAIFLWLWEEMRIKFREKYLTDGRRISYKSLNDRKRKKVLVPFLSAANSIPGLCITFCVDKDIPSLFEKHGILDLTQPEYQEYRHWKPIVFEKLLRIAHFSSLILACMSAPNQDILWITDEDEIVPNELRLREVCKIFSHHMNHYLSHYMGQTRFGTTKSDDGSRSIEDLTAIPDIVAGAISDIAKELPGESGKAINQFILSRSTAEKDKTRLIFDWYCDPNHTLKRLLVSIKYNENRQVIPLVTHFDCADRPRQFFWHEEFEEIIFKK